MAGMIYWNKQKKCHLSEATQPNQASTHSITVWFYFFIFLFYSLNPHCWGKYNMVKIEYMK